MSVSYLTVPWNVPVSFGLMKRKEGKDRVHWAMSWDTQLTCRENNTVIIGEVAGVNPISRI